MQCTVNGNIISCVQFQFNNWNRINYWNLNVSSNAWYSCYSIFFLVAILGDFFLPVSYRSFRLFSHLFLSHLFSVLSDSVPRCTPCLLPLKILFVVVLPDSWWRSVIWYVSSVYPLLRSYFVVWKKTQWNRTNYESSIGCCIYFYFLSFKQDCSRSGMKQINQLCFTYVSYYFSDANLSRDAGDL